MPILLASKGYLPLLIEHYVIRFLLLFLRLRITLFRKLVDVHNCYITVCLVGKSSNPDVMPPGRDASRLVLCISSCGMMFSLVSRREILPYAVPPGLNALEAS